MFTTSGTFVQRYSITVNQVMVATVNKTGGKDEPNIVFMRIS